MLANSCMLSQQSWFWKMNMFVDCHTAMAVISG